MLEINHILVPVDFTETSKRALEHATELAKKFGAWITVMHAYQIPVLGFPEGAYIAAAEVATQLATAAQRGLEAVVQDHKLDGVVMKSVLRDGVPWEEINAVAKEVRADLIVIGTHGRRGLARALLGSVAENVIRTTALPVFVIHGLRDES